MPSSAIFLDNNGKGSARITTYTTSFHFQLFCSSYFCTCFVTLASFKHLFLWANFYPWIALKDVWRTTYETAQGERTERFLEKVCLKGIEWKSFICVTQFCPKDEILYKSCNFGEAHFIFPYNLMHIGFDTITLNKVKSTTYNICNNLLRNFLVVLSTF